MFPQRLSGCSGGGSGLDQMLQLPSYVPVPLPLPTPNPMDHRSSSSSRWKPNIEVAPNCPRCASTNTKFCYYNNYSLSQPRYFCKSCRRYWTKGGSLRNVPVGGGCRKNRRGKSARHMQSSTEQRVSTNNAAVGLGSFHGNNCGSDDRDYSSETNNGSRDIDMALVFAKFLNQQNPTSGEEFEMNNEANNNGSSSSNNLSTSLTPESVDAENDAVFHSHETFDPIMTDSDALQLGDGVGVSVEETMIQNFVGDDEELNLSGIDELEGLLQGVGCADEDVVQDALWSDATTMSPSVTNWQWQSSMMQTQLQEVEYSMPLKEVVGQLPVSSTVNLISDSWSTTWSSFDLSTLEIFSSSIP